MAANTQVASNNSIEAQGPIPANNPSAEYQLKEYLLLLATLVATVTYVAGLNLPGGVWQDTRDGHLAGDLILRDTYYLQYVAFYYCNATAFAASLVACLLLLVLDEESKVWAVALRAVMVFDLLGLMGAYAAGSCRDKFTTIYSSVLVTSVVAYIMCVFIIACLRVLRKKPDKDVEKQGEDHGAHKREEEHKVLMPLAIFAVTITYVAGLNPPGGFWSSTEDGHHVSEPIMQDHNSSRYQAFFVCNTTAFVASLLIIVLLLDKKLSKALSAKTFLLYVFIAVALFGLVGAYAAGSCREADSTTYVVCLAGAVLAYIFLQIAITEVIRWRRCESLKNICAFTSKWLKKIGNLFTLPSRAAGTDKELEKNRYILMLLANLVVSITYQAGLDPPGGLWQDNQDGHKSGAPILLTTHHIRYKVFFYSNSAAFVASLVVIMMVQCRFLLHRHTLHAVMLLDLFGLIGAYAAGSCRDLSTSVYLVALAGVVLVYVVIHMVFFTLEDQTDNPQDSEKLDKRREMLLVLAILAATLTYQAGLTPPGGFWPADDSSGHRAGSPILLDNYPRRYNAFFYCNAASFMASVTLIVLLVNPTLYKPGIRCYALYVCMVMGMFGIMGAYAAGSTRRIRTSKYVFMLVAAVFAFVTTQVVIFWFRNRKKKVRGNNSTSGTVNGSSGSGQGGSIGASHEPGAPDTGTEEKDLREYLMLVGVLAASMTYQTGLKPPGGLWQDNRNGHSAGNSILSDIDKGRYRAFFYSNSTSFMASIVVIVLLLPWKLKNPKNDDKLPLDVKLPLWPMHTAILLDMLGLLGAYAAGSTREWEKSRNVILLVVPVLVPVLAYIGAYAAVSLYHKKRNPSLTIPNDEARA